MKKPANRKNKKDVTFAREFVDLPINTGKYKQLGVYKTMLKPLLAQINAVLTYHSRVSLFVFELHLPVTVFLPADSANLLVSKFFKKIKEDLASSIFGNQKQVIHFWAREVGKSKNGHYHCMIGVSSTVRIGMFHIAPATHAWGLLDRRWRELSGGFMNGNKCHVVNRNNRTELATAFKHLSYSCKTRGKQFGTGENHKRFSTSRLPPKKVAIQPTTDQQESLEYLLAA